MKKTCIVCIDDFVVTLQQHLSEALNEACADKMYLKLIDKNDIMTAAPVAVMLKPGDIVLLKMDSYMGRRKTKNKWSYENYMVLHQLGPDIPTYKIQAEGGSSHIVHRI